MVNEQTKEGKIVMAVLGIIHVIVLKTLQYLLSQTLQTRWPIILDLIVCRLPDLPYKFISIIYTSLYSVWATTFGISYLQ